MLIETPRRTATVRSIDVSGGGLKVTSAVDAAVGERVTVYFELPIGFGIEALAEVQRCDGDTMVVRFLGLARESELAIRSFCRISGLRPATVPVGSSPAPLSPAPLVLPGPPDTLP